MFATHGDFCGRIALGLAAAGLAASALAQGIGPAFGPVKSQRGLYRAVLQSAQAPIGINRMSSWTLTLQDANGADIEAATIAIEAGVPGLARVMPTSPRATRALAPGRYLIEGVKFDMAGRWRVQLAIAAAPGRDRVAFDIEVK